MIGRLSYSNKAELGMLIRLQWAAWRITCILPIDSETDIARFEHRQPGVTARWRAWSENPYSRGQWVELWLECVTDPGRKPWRILLPPEGYFPSWRDVNLDPLNFEVLGDRYPVCGDCGQLWPCQDEHLERIVQHAAVMAKNACARCGRRLASSAMSITVPGDGTPDGPGERLYCGRKGPCRTEGERELARLKATQR